MIDLNDPMAAKEAFSLGAKSTAFQSASHCYSSNQARRLRYRWLACHAAIGISAGLWCFTSSCRTCYALAMLRHYARPLIDRWKDRGRIRLLARLYELRSHTLRAPDEVAIIRQLSDEVVHNWLSREIPAASRIALERELRRREAWQAPAGRSALISMIAVLISLVALLVSVGSR